MPTIMMGNYGSGISIKDDTPYCVDRAALLDRDPDYAKNEFKDADDAAWFESTAVDAEDMCRCAPGYRGLVWSKVMHSMGDYQPKRRERTEEDRQMDIREDLWEAETTAARYYAYQEQYKDI